MGLHRRLERFRRDDGLGIVEVVAAVGVLFVALLALAYTATNALNDIGLARQRQGATAVANDVLEQVRALDFGEIEDGLSSTDPNFDPTTDPNIIDCGGSPPDYRFDSCAGEEIISTPGLSATPPLIPHRAAATPPDSPTSYERLVYITRVPPDAATPQGTYRATVLASWDSDFRRGVSTTVEMQTLLYNPSGCPDPSSTPVAAPCLASFFGTGSITQGGIGIRGTLNGQPVDGSLGTVGARSDAQLVETDRVQGNAIGTITTLGGTTAGGQTATSSADNDATSSTPDSDSSLLSPAAPGTVSQSAGGVTLNLSTGTDEGRSTSVLDAGQPGHECPRPSTAPHPSAQTDGEPCGHSWARQGGSLQARLGIAATVSGISVNLGTATLADIPAPTEPTWTHIDRTAQTATDGSVTAAGERSISELELFGLPSALSAPTGWNGYLIRLVSYSDEVRAEAGASSEPPSATVGPGARLEYWTPTGYEQVDLTQGGAGSVANVSLSVGGSVLTIPVAVEISGNLSRGGGNTQSDGVGNGVARREARAEISSPLSGTFTYKITAGTVTLADLVIDIDLGTLLARASYQEVSGG